MILTALIAAVGMMCVHMAFVADADVWWQMRTGQWILNHHGFPQTDPFSIHGADVPWQAYSWLFDLVVLKLFEQWGLAGLVVYNTVLVVAITAALYHLLHRLQPDSTKVVLLAFVSMGCMTRLFTPRPWLFTILFFILELDILLQARKTGKLRELLWLPLIFALWANIHIQFIDGFVVLGIAAAEPIVERWWPYQQTRLKAGTIWAILGACIVGTCVNPYGWRLYQVAYQLASQKGVLGRVAEMGALPFRGFEDFLYLFLVLAGAGALAWTRRFPVFETCLLGAGAIISFRSERDIWFVIIVASMLLASALPSHREQPAALPVIAIPIILVVVLGILRLGAVIFQVNHATLQKQLVDTLPVRAVQTIEDRGYKGPIFNDYSWGGYLIWNLREMPPSIDGRAALQGDKALARSGNTWSGQAGWSSDPDLKAANVVLAPIHLPLTQLLRLDPQFHLVYEDKLAAVFVRRTPGCRFRALEPTPRP
ncbi:MAG TPA: hypothetical protein VFI20_02895 [Terracidiphilus sp.]|nr:hypothetical protein [Terracidiphilus sp.]